MAAVSTTIVSAHDGAFSVTITYDDVTRIVAGVVVVNTTGQAIHSQVSDGTRSWSVTIPVGGLVVTVPPGLLYPVAGLTTYHRVPD